MGNVAMVSLMALIEVNQVKLNREEERISKIGAKNLYESGELKSLEVGTWASLSWIHGALFEEIYDFAGQIREVNIAKGNFRFAPVMFLEASLEHLDKMPHGTFDEIVEKYVEMNITHPFRDGNGCATRLWLDMMFKKSLGKVVDWNRIGKEDYLLAMQRSPIKDIEIKHLLRGALTEDLSWETFFKGLDVSYYYEGYSEFQVEDL